MITTTTNPIDVLKELIDNNYVTCKRDHNCIKFYYSFWIDDDPSKQAFATLYLDHTNHYLINDYGGDTNDPQSTFNWLKHSLVQISDDANLLKQAKRIIK